ncbi:MAG: PP2C family serine/threonine-protein phosphatase, partial [Gemmatimonadota bacterium]
MTVKRWRSAARSDRGRVRDNNEDDCLLRPDDGLFVVADGMGGHAAGEVASRLAVEVLEEELAGGGRSAEDLPSPDGIVEAVQKANRTILRDGRENPERAGMGTTVTALTLSARGRWRIGHVGDSRAYRYRAGEGEQVRPPGTLAGPDGRHLAGDLFPHRPRR